jgi:hypothetical protein
LSAFIASNFQTVGFAAPFSAASQLALRPSRGSLLFGDSRGRDQALPGFVGGIGGHSDRNAVWPVEAAKLQTSLMDRTAPCPWQMGERRFFVPRFPKKQCTI